MKKDFIITFLTEFIVLASGILVFKFASAYLGDDGFSEYALSRRVLSFIQPVLVLGLTIGIPRYISFRTEETTKKDPDTYFVGGLCLMIVSAVCGSLILYILRDYIAFLFFGNSDYAHLVYPIDRKSVV